MAISKTDVFDFLIDIVPRDDIKSTSRKMDGDARAADVSNIYLQMAQMGYPGYSLAVRLRKTSKNKKQKEKQKTKRKTKIKNKNKNKNKTKKKRVPQEL